MGFSDVQRELDYHEYTETLPEEVWNWLDALAMCRPDETGSDITEPLIYVRLTTDPDVFANVPLRFLDERVEWSIPGDKCATVVISHYWKGTDVCVKRAPHVCLAVLAEVKTEQGLVNSPAVPASTAVLPSDDPLKPYTITSDL